MPRTIWLRVKTPTMAPSASLQTRKHLTFACRQRLIHLAKASESMGGVTQPRWDARLIRFSATICCLSRVVGSRRKTCCATSSAFLRSGLGTPSPATEHRAHGPSGQAVDRHTQAVGDPRDVDRALVAFGGIRDAPRHVLAPHPRPALMREGTAIPEAI